LLLCCQLAYLLTCLLAHLPDCQVASLPACQFAGLPGLMAAHALISRTPVFSHCGPTRVYFSPMRCVALTGFITSFSSLLTLEMVPLMALGMAALTIERNLT